jgi:FAD synthetase
MTGKILTFDEIEKTSKKERINRKKIILVGGCFDLLHKGHIDFLNQAKRHGDRLFVLLESDDNITKIKGKNRPINSQSNRTIVLSSLKSVSYIIPLRGMTKSEEYDKLIVLIRPNVIAITKGDPHSTRRKEQCEMVDAKLVLIERVITPSTTELIKGI